MEKFPLYIESKPESACNEFLQSLPGEIHEVPTYEKRLVMTDFDDRAKMASVPRLTSEETTILVSAETPQGFVSSIIRDRMRHACWNGHIPQEYKEVLEELRKIDKRLVMLFTHTTGRTPDANDMHPSLGTALQIATNIAHDYSDIAVHFYIPPHRRHQSLFAKRIVTATPQKNGTRAVFFEHGNRLLPGPMRRWIHELTPKTRK